MPTLCSRPVGTGSGCMPLHRTLAAPWPVHSSAKPGTSSATSPLACAPHRHTATCSAAEQPASNVHQTGGEINALQQAAVTLASAAVAAAVLSDCTAQAAQLQAFALTASAETVATTAALRQSGLGEVPGATAAAPAAQLLPQGVVMADVGLLRLDDLPRPDKPFQVFGYLLKHPLAALAVGGGLAWAVPRLVRAGLRFIVVPAAALFLLYLAARNPGFVFNTASSAVSAVQAHPIATSAVILIVSGLSLSPYILVAGLALLLVTGTQLLPGFMRPALPGPISEALHQVDVMQAHTKTALEQLAAAVRTAPPLSDGSRK